MTTWYEREIHEQPATIAGVLERAPAQLARWLADVPPALPLLLVARGTSDHAATYARYALALLADRDALLALPSLTTLHGRAPARDAAVVGISQSGRSPDLVQVMDRATAAGWPTLAVVNDADAPLAAAARTVLDLACGPERAVAATKSYTASLAAVAVLSAQAADPAERPRLLDELVGVPDRVEAALGVELPASVVEVLAAADRVLVVGRGVDQATAQEVALKLQETTGIMAQAWSPADLLHGPVAAAGPGTPVLAVATGHRTRASVHAAVADAARRGSPVVRLQPVGAGDGTGRDGTTGEVVETPSPPADWLAPLVDAVVAQRLVGAVAAARGDDVDRPRGLGKVTETR
jgi:glutamine---fructose-6-phosphate transaminase (isomerizing)